jgi:hypothetical protein
VNDFVEQCRREWKRLRVPDRVADEMAAELAADLSEAEAEGASAEEVLGSAATDPRSFAASWAAERAVIPRPRLTARLPVRPIMLAAIAALMVITAVGAALVIFASPHTQTPQAAAIRAPRTSVSSVWVQRGGGIMLTLANGTGVAIRGGPPSWASPTLRLPLPPSPSSVALLRMPRSGVHIHRVGSILLIVGIAGLIPSMLFLYRSSRSRQDRTTAHA